LRRIARQLDELRIPYAIAGSMALFFYGVRRFTEDVDILVTREGLQAIHQRQEELRCLPLFPGSKNLRDAVTGVRIEFLLTGDYPGGGLATPISFPDPVEASTEIEGFRFLQLPRLVELKLASGMTNRGRLKDLADAQWIIETLNLPEDFAAQLHPFVQEKYKEIWTIVHSNPP